MTNLTIRPGTGPKNVFRPTGGQVSVRGSVGTGGGVTPWFNEDFSSYADSTALQGASWISNGAYGFWGTLSGMSLDTTEGYGSSGKCMKATWAIGDRHMGVYLTLPSSTSEYWTEIWAKVSTTFQTIGSTSPDGDGNPDYKFVFWMLGDGVSEGAGRCQIKLGEYGPMDRLETRYDLGPADLFITAAQSLSSGIWHRYRAHLRLSGASTSIWNVDFYDGTNAVQEYRQENVDLGSFTHSSYMQIGAYMNQYATQAMNIKWGKITLYNSDPGWGL